MSRISKTELKKAVKNKKNDPFSHKQSRYMVAAKVIMLILTAVFSVFMVVMSGAGIIHNRAHYGAEITGWGRMFVFSSVLMTAGALLCIPRKSIANAVSFFCTLSGCAVCLATLSKLAAHAKKAGWVSAVTGVPARDMYISRITPVIAPCALAVTIAAVQFFSYEAREERRIRKQQKNDRENAPSPPIV